jgi:hypothetical protein
MIMRFLDQYSDTDVNLETVFRKEFGRNQYYMNLTTNTKKFREDMEKGEVIKGTKFNYRVCTEEIHSAIHFPGAEEFRLLMGDEDKRSGDNNNNENFKGIARWSLLLEMNIAVDKVRMEEAFIKSTMRISLQMQRTIEMICSTEQKYERAKGYVKYVQARRIELISLEHKPKKYIWFPKEQPVIEVKTRI